MADLRRGIARLIERHLGYVIVPRWEAPLVPERLHLSRFFNHFGVDCVFDVGANRGQYATMLRQGVGFTGQIISYEPAPDEADVLRSRAAKDRNWHVETLAIDREAGPATFYVMAGSEFSSLHAPAPDQPGEYTESNRVVQEIRVRRSTMAEELPKWKSKLGFRRPFLKIDTQGNDAAVVLGAGEALDDFVGLQTELSIVSLYEGATGFVEAIAALRSRGFELSALVPNNSGQFPRLIEMDCIMYRRDAWPTPRAEGHRA